MSKITTTITLGLLLGATALMANSENMAKSLMKLRAEVEQLDTQIGDEKDAYKAQMKSLAIQKSELEATVSRENLKIKQLQKELANIQEKIQNAGKNSAGLKPIVLDAIEKLQLTIQQEIPFKTAERKASLQEIKTEVENSLITPQKALSLVYNAYADEMRMTKENGIFKQSIVLDGESKLVEVARIGSVMMFFKTPDERVGYVVKDGTEWSYKEEFEKKKKDEIVSLFDAFKKQIRTGYFVLPNALTTSEVK